MKSIDRINDEISDILPDSSDLLGTDGLEQRASIVQNTSKTIHDRKTAQELARAKLRIAKAAEGQAAREAVEAYKQKKQDAKDKMFQQLEDENTARPVTEIISTANNIAVQNGQPAMAENIAKQLILSQGTTRPEVVKLLSTLNINLDLQLTKNDTGAESPATGADKQARAKAKANNAIKIFTIPFCAY